MMMMRRRRGWGEEGEEGEKVVVGAPASTTLSMARSWKRKRAEMTQATNEIEETWGARGGGEG